MMTDALIADMIAIVGSLDTVMGEVDRRRLLPTGSRTRRPLPRASSAVSRRCGSRRAVRLALAGCTARLPMRST
jgi:hypothetical protein